MRVDARPYSQRRQLAAARMNLVPGLSLRQSYEIIGTDAGYCIDAPSVIPTGCTAEDCGVLCDDFCQRGDAS